MTDAGRGWTRKASRIAITRYVVRLLDKVRGRNDFVHQTRAGSGATRPG